MSFSSWPPEYLWSISILGKTTQPLVEESWEPVPLVQ